MLYVWNNALAAGRWVEKRTAPSSHYRVTRQRPQSPGFAASRWREFVAGINRITRQNAEWKRKFSEDSLR